MQINNRLSRKRKGNVADLVSALFIIIALITFMVIIFDSMQLLNYKNNLDQITRQYILVLETEGELNPQTVKNKIKELGYNAAVVVNNSMGRKTYGEEVSLKIEVNATPTQLRLFASNLLKQSIYPYKSVMKSISKAR